MRATILVIALCACGSSKETSTVSESHTTGGSGSAAPQPPPRTPVPTADENALARVYEQLNTGDAWKSAVMKVVAIAGPPNIVEDEGPVLDWFAAGKDTCTILQMAPEREYVGRTKHTQFGTAADEYKPCTKAVKQRAKLPALADPRPIDVEAPARAVLAAWHDGQFQKIVDDAHPEFREGLSADQLAHIAKRFEPVAGKLVSVGTPIRTEIADFSYVATGPAVFDKGTLAFRLAFRVVDDKPRLYHVDLKLPKELQATPDNDAGEKVARHALDAVLANKFADVLAIGSDELLRAVHQSPDAPKEVAKIARGFGKIRSIKLHDQRDCDGRRCVTYDLTGAKARGSAEVVVVFSISAWEVAGVTLTPAR